MSNREWDHSCSACGEDCCCEGWDIQICFHCNADKRMETANYRLLLIGLILAVLAF